MKNLILMTHIWSAPDNESRMNRAIRRFVTKVWTTHLGACRGRDHPGPTSPIVVVITRSILQKTESKNSASKSFESNLKNILEVDVFRKSQRKIM